MSEAEELELLELEREKYLSSMSNQKPMMGKYFPSAFPSPREAARSRMDEGMQVTPPEPVAEYSPAEELMLGSVLGPQAVAQGAGLIGKADALYKSPSVYRNLAAPSRVAPIVQAGGRGLLALGKGAVNMAKASSPWTRAGIGGFLFEGGRRIFKGLMR